MKYEEEKISIVIPLYNGEKYIEQTLQYIFNSTYQNLEIIIVNDGSQDKSQILCERMQKKDSRIVILNKENEGVVSARNYGAESATGNYLCFCDQDDIVEPKMYEKMITRIRQDKSDICMCSTERYVNGKKTVFEVWDEGYYRGETILHDVLYPILFNGYKVPVKMKNSTGYFHIWNCLFSMTFWKKYHFTFRAYVNFEDDFLMRVDTICHAESISTVAYPGYCWRVNFYSETFAHHFVKNIGEKQQLVLEDLKQSLRRKTNDERVLQLFEQVTMCRLYVDAVHNVTSKEKKKNIKTIKEYFTRNIYQYHFDTSIVARKYLRKGRIRPKILLSLLASKRNLSIYVAEVILDYISLFTLHSPTLAKLERKMKKNR